MKYSTHAVSDIRTVVAVVTFTEEEWNYFLDNDGGADEALSCYLDEITSDLLTDAGIDPLDDECEHSR